MKTKQQKHKTFLGGMGVRYIENIEYNLDEFEQMLSGLTIFENEIPIAKNIDNANREPMNITEYKILENKLFIA